MLKLGNKKDQASPTPRTRSFASMSGLSFNHNYANNQNNESFNLLSPNNNILSLNSGLSIGKIAQSLTVHFSTKVCIYKLCNNRFNEQRHLLSKDHTTAQNQTKKSHQMFLTAYLSSIELYTLGPVQFTNQFLSFWHRLVFPAFRKRTDKEHHLVFGTKLKAFGDPFYQWPKHELTIIKFAFCNNFATLQHVQTLLRPLGEWICSLFRKENIN